MASAIGTYATLANVKARMGITDSGDDATLQRFCDQSNQWVEDKTSRVLAPFTLSAATFDGWDAVENGRCMLFDFGINTISLLRIAITTGNTFSTIPSTDYFLRPVVSMRDSGWPATELWMTDIPSASNAVPYFPRGFGNIEITTPANGAGWAVMPDDIIGIAEKVTVVAWQLRQSGVGNSIGDDFIGTAIQTALDRNDWRTMNSYTAKPVAVI